MKENKPIATSVFVAINVIVFAFMEIIGDTLDTEFMCSAGAMFPYCIIEEHEYWRFFTSNYMHFGFEHLINNIIVLFAAGRYCEQALGHIKFSAMYVVSGVLGSILSYVMMIVRNDYAVSAGASGAIFGVFGALLWVVIINKGRFEEFDGKGILFMIALALYFGISSGAADNWGHIGGLISGFIFAVIFYQTISRKLPPQ